VGDCAGKIDNITYAAVVSALTEPEC